MIRLMFVLLISVGTSLDVRAQPAVGGYAVQVIDDGGRIIRRSVSGIANPELGMPVSAETVFHVASLSKQVTAAALVMAIEDGRVSLDAPLSRFVPEAKKYGDRLTLAHLIYFSSGLTEPYALERQSGMPWFTHYYFSIDEAIATSLSAEALQFQPGDAWQYSNINYMLITKVIESLYGVSLSDFVENRIFEPLGMHASRVNDDITEVIPLRADGVLPRTPDVLAALSDVGIVAQAGDGIVLMRRNSPHIGGSGVMSSLSDWARWQREILTQDAFGEAFWSQMLSQRRFSHEKHNDAMGLVHGDIDGHSVVWFAGDDIDASSHSIVATDAGLASVCFSNNRFTDCRSMAIAAIRAALDAPL